MEDRVSRANARLMRAAASKLGVTAGAEIVAAVEAAARVGSERVWLVDRPMSATRRRQLATTGKDSAVRVQAELASRSAEQLKSEVDGLLGAGGGAGEPELEATAAEAANEEVMVAERDRWMARKALEVVSGAPTSPGFAMEEGRLRYDASGPPPPGSPPRTLVLVVGLAHVNGIAEAWSEVAELDCETLL